MRLPELGPFAGMFEKTDRDVPGYLKLLHLQGDGVDTAIRQVKAVVHEAIWEPYAIELLSGPDWRPHLVVCVALISKPKQEVLEALWQAFDSGSWVAPQLAVAAYFSDPKFAERARSRIEAGCPITPRKRRSVFLRLLAIGTRGTVEQSAKNMASLLTLCGRLPALSPWIAHIQAQPAVVDLLKIDEAWNRSADIVEQWFLQITVLFEREGVALDPPDGR